MTQPITHGDLDRVERVELPATARSRIEAAAADAYPREGCGVLIGEARADSIRVEIATVVRNLAGELSHRRYELDPAGFVAADRLARERGLDVVGFWHSHPDHPAEPSRKDLEDAWPGYLYVIVETAERAALAVRAWRLGSSGFYEQTIRPEDSR